MDDEGEHRREHRDRHSLITATFTYDNAGNRTSATDSRGVVVNYTYDALNRLKVSEA